MFFTGNYPHVMLCIKLYPVVANKNVCKSADVASFLCSQTITSNGRYYALVQKKFKLYTHTNKQVFLKHLSPEF